MIQCAIRQKTTASLNLLHLPKKHSTKKVWRKLSNQMKKTKKSFQKSAHIQQNILTLQEKKPIEQELNSELHYAIGGGARMMKEWKRLTLV